MTMHLFGLVARLLLVSVLFGAANPAHAWWDQQGAYAACQGDLATMNTVDNDVVAACTLEINIQIDSAIDGLYRRTWVQKGTTSGGNHSYTFSLPNLDALDTHKAAGCPQGNCGVAGVDPASGNRFESTPVLPRTGASPSSSG